MPDQADELRKLVADMRLDPDERTRVEMSWWPDVLYKNWDEMTEAEQALYADDHRRGRVAFAFHVKQAPTPDKAKLWDELKAELEGESRGANTGANTPWSTAFSQTPESILAASLLERMTRAEVLATYVRPATDATWDRVAKTLEVKG